MIMELLDALCWILLSLVALWCGIHRLNQIGKPGYRTWPVIGATWQVLENYHHIYDWILWNFKVMNTLTTCIPLLAQSYVVTVDPVNVEHILKSNFHNFPKGDVFHERFEPLLGDGIFNSDGETWRIQRKIASFEFASRKLREWSSKVFKEYALKLAGIIHEGNSESFDIQDLFMRMTLDTICSLGFGVQLGVLSPSFPDNEFATAFDRCNAIVSYRFADPFWKLKKFLRVGDESRLPKYIATIDSFTYNIIQQRRLHLQSLKDGAEAKQDLLSRFLMLDEKFSDKNLRDIVLNFVIAGRDTTASTLTYFIYMISSHPDVADRLQTELKQFDERRSPNSNRPTGDESDDQLQDMQRFTELLTYDSLSELNYLQATIYETLRLYPAVPLNFKGIARRDVFPDGTVVHPGDIVSYVPYCMGRMEVIWGPDAAEFRPERWLSSNGAWDFNVSPFKFTVFQAGPRICLGKDSALLQMKITAAVLCRFLNFSLVPGQDLKYRVMATISLANGLRVMAPCKNTLLGAEKK